MAFKANAEIKMLEKASRIAALAYFFSMKLLGIHS